MLIVLAGPALSGKSTLAEALIDPDRGEVLIDFSRLYSAITVQPRGELRRSGLPVGMVQAVRMAAIREAAERGLSGVITVADGRREVLDQLQALAGGAPLFVLDFPEAAIDRIIAAGQRAPDPSRAEARRGGRWRADCGKAAKRWFGKYRPSETDIRASRFRRMSDAAAEAELDAADELASIAAGDFDAAEKVAAGHVVEFKPDPEILRAIRQLEDSGLEVPDERMLAWALRVALDAGDENAQRLTTALHRAVDVSDLEDASFAFGANVGSHEA